MKRLPLPRLDTNLQVREQLLPLCRLKPGQIWEDPEGRHRVGCLDATQASHVAALMGQSKATLAIHDPPYNLVAFERRSIDEYTAWCELWVGSTAASFEENASLYVWLGADQTCDFQPLPDFMVMMRRFEQFRARSFITMRNQRGYGTQKNWMAVRQELLYYTKGDPFFEVQYTDIPKILRGYYKEVGGIMTENLQRSRSQNIRAGNVWVDVQQVFYRMEENVSGCYAQKPLKAIERILRAGSRPQDIVIDFFSHSGTTLLAAERLGRRCFTMDIDPVFCEITIRRLERYREKGLLGWQGGHPFEGTAEIDNALRHAYTGQELEVAEATLF
ncbi:MAG TPA: site-specific DNA-methyltransferase [Sedimentisphaerales bacterium]|jgi:site-specific DNA-methyltransferase (adenine-specific)|nr:site-specific DNA-methyltransferase [Sedimentisphaerales bacterium]HNU31223.1 site-specific DNA-methyltransferase [Sedimentisphaerales bacterium]